MKRYNVAVVGATGLVGRTMLSVLEERQFPVDTLIPLATKKSAGKKVPFRGEEWVVEELTETSFDRPIDIALFSAGASTSATFAPIAAKKGVLVIDNSSQWRQVKGIPLIVPEVNPELLSGYHGIVANPNCSTIQCMAILRVLRDAYGLKRVVYSTYQAAAGAGVKGLYDLENGTTSTFDVPLPKNVIPRIDVFLPDGYTKEEWKMIHETRKILALPELPVTATCVRVPVDYGHSVAMNVELENDFSVEEIRHALSRIEGIVVKDNPEELVYPTPIDGKHKDTIFVGRIRRDISRSNTVHLWCVADNIRKGAATNTVQIAEAWLKRNAEEA